MADVKCRKYPLKDIAVSAALPIALASLKSNRLRIQMTEDVLQIAWAERCKIRQRGIDLFKAANEVRNEGQKLQREADTLWQETVTKSGRGIMQWKNYDAKKNDWECHLSTGEIFKP